MGADVGAGGEVGSGRGVEMIMGELGAAVRIVKYTIPPPTTRPITEQKTI
jgi:hypothetical protein